MQKGFIQFIVLGIVVLVIVTAGAFYLGKQVVAPKPQPQTIQIPPSSPTASPAPTGVDETSNWKTYVDNSLSFKYPSTWNISGTVITSESPKISMTIVLKGGTLMNECMQVISEEAKNGLMVKRFTKVTTGAMCEGSDANLKEIWVIPSKDAYAPGISYSYLNSESRQAEEIFDKILSTFKFLN